jgi:hypothetical protein
VLNLQSLITMTFKVLLAVTLCFGVCGAISKVSSKNSEMGRFLQDLEKVDRLTELKQK